MELPAEMELTLTMRSLMCSRRRDVSRKGAITFTAHVRSYPSSDFCKTNELTRDLPALPSRHSQLKQSSKFVQVAKYHPCSWPHPVSQVIMCVRRGASKTDWCYSTAKDSA